MKFWVAVVFLGLGVCAQSKEASVPLPQGVPAGSTMLDGNTWRFVDKQGKVWLYRSSPFGMMRTEEPRETQVSQKPPSGAPADSKLVPGTHFWRAVDAQGKAWLYHESPAGIMKTAETEEILAAARASSKPQGKLDGALALMSVKEEGDSLRFTKPGPFGTYSWVKKKTMLTSDEALVWEHAQAKSAEAKK